MRRTINICWVILIIQSCGENTQDLTIGNPKIKQALDKKYAQYASDVLETCKRDVMDKAELYVDSLISAEISFRVSDSIIFPEKPIKPNSLGKILVADTIKAKPIFK